MAIDLLSSQATIAVRSKPLRAEEIIRLRTDSLAAIVTTVIGLDELAFWVHEKHPLNAIQADDLYHLLFECSNDRDLPAWGKVGVASSNPASSARIVVLLPSGTGESGTKDTAQESFRKRDSELIRLPGQEKRSATDITSIPGDITHLFEEEGVYAMGLASRRFTISEPLKPLLVTDSQGKQIRMSRELYAYGLIKKEQGRPSLGVCEVMAYLLSDELQRRLRVLGFRAIDSSFAAKQRGDWAALCSDGVRALSERRMSREGILYATTR